MFLYNYWYVAAMREEIGNAPLARTLLGEPVVLYRLADGTPVALEDQCVHRRAPLSMGRVIGDTLECAYHGLAYAGDGRCVRVPGQAQIPTEAKVRSYPVVDRFNWTWIWMGDPALADESRIPNVYWGDAPDWALVYDLTKMQGDHRFLVDNLMDLSHLSFLHQRTIGVRDADLTEISTERREDTVIVERWARNTAVPPMIERVQGLKAPIDRWQKCIFVPPSGVLIEVGIVPAGADPSEVEGGRGCLAWVINLITPETETSTHYFWGHARNYAIDDAEVHSTIHRDVAATFVEDVAIIEGQQRNLDAKPDTRTVDIGVDSGPLQTRRLIERLHEVERASRAQAA